MNPQNPKHNPSALQAYYTRDQGGQGRAEAMDEDSKEEYSQVEDSKEEDFKVEAADRLKKNITNNIPILQSRC